MNRIDCEYASLVNPKELTPNPNNRNRHSEEQIERLSQLLEHHGWRHPIIVSKRSGLIVAGHGRLLAAMKLGLKEVPVDFQDFDSEEAEYAFGISDNAIALWAELDLAGINHDLPDLGPDLDIDLLGIKDFKLDPSEIGMKEGNIEDDELPDTDGNEFGVERGQVWKLGDHRLMCGDSTSRTDVEILMNGTTAEFCFTSPPYGMGGNSKLSGNKVTSSRGSVYNTPDEPENWYELMEGWVDAALPAVENFAVNIQMLAGNKRNLVKWMYKYSDRLIDILTWDKGHTAPAMAEGVLSSSFEWLILLGAEGASRSIPYSSWRGTVKSVYSADPQRTNEFSSTHGATMPMHFPLWFLETLCDQAKSIYEPFCGTGTTLIACEKAGRVGYGMEIDPNYCSITIKRYQEFTGKEAELIHARDEEQKV